MSNIIDSLKRLERVGSETSVVTLKLKKSVESVAYKLYEVMDYVDIDPTRPSPTKVLGKLYTDGKYLFWDWDGNMYGYNYHDYNLRSGETWVARSVALHFAQAIAEGFLDKISDWLEEQKAKTETALSKLPIQE